MGRVRWVALAALIAGGALYWQLQPTEPELVVPELGCIITLANPPPVEEPLEEDAIDEATCACTWRVGGTLSLEQRETLELACQTASDEACRYPFEVFSTLEQGDRTAVIVKRSTGDCGGCGALAFAAIYERGVLQASGELGRFGRFGNGPDSARFVTVAGEPALEVTASESHGGYSSEYRELFTRHGDGLERGICIETEWDDRGAQEHATAWKASLRYHPDGGIGVRYTSVQRGGAKPDLSPVTIGFDRRARSWIFEREGCVSPPRPGLIDI